MSHGLFRLKSVEDTVGHGELKRTMGRSALLYFSVGSIIGSGIFVILGVAIPKAGPAVMLSFLLAAVAALFSALSYAELASTIPASGSSYSYAYVTLGEIVAWAVGWMLMLEYGVAVAAVAVGWGEYLNEFLGAFGVTIPAAFASPPGDGGVFNIPAIVVVFACMFLLIRGASESARVNAIMVLLKIGILIFFCAVAFTAFDGNNLEPFLPLGIQPWESFEGQGSEAVLSSVANNAVGGTWAGTLIAVGAIISIFSVVLVTLYGQTRILFAMGRDGLLPKAFTRVNPRTQTPVFNTVIVCVIIAIPAAFVSLLAEATSIGTLGAFAVVNIGVIVLRRKRPDLPRGFTTPLFPLMPILGLILIVVIVAGLDPVTWLVFALWMAVGFTVYFAYSRRHSVLNTPKQTQ